MGHCNSFCRIRKQLETPSTKPTTQCHQQWTPGFFHKCTRNGCLQTWITLHFIEITLNKFETKPFKPEWWVQDRIQLATCFNGLCIRTHCGAHAAPYKMSISLCFHLTRLPRALGNISTWQNRSTPSGEIDESDDLIKVRVNVVWWSGDGMVAVWYRS